MEQSPGYREGIEDSIRRCEELLALTPLAFETSASGLRRGYAVKEADVELSKEAFGNPKEDDSSTSSAKKLWKWNMELLSSGTTRSHETFDCKSELRTDVNKLEDQTSSEWSKCTSGQQTLSPNKSATKNSNSFVNRSAGCGHRYEWESEWSGASSEWNADRMCQGPNQTSESQVEDSAHSSEKSITNNKTDGRLHTLCPIGPQTVRESQIDDLRQSKETDLSTKDSRDSREVISVRISDPSVRELPDRTCPCNAKPDLKDESISFYGKHPQCSSAACLYSETEENGPPSQYHMACSQQESSSEILQASTPDGSGVSQVALDATWDTSDRPTSPESEQKTDTTLSSRSEQNMQHGHFHRLQHQSFQDKGRSKSVPKEVPRVNKLAKHQRSKSVFRERVEDRLQTLARPRTEVYKKLAELKAILEREELQQCSFKPLVGRRPDPESLHSAPIFERIMEIQRRLELRKRARKAYEKEELDNCSFWPRINWRSQVFDKITYQPIQNRFQELQRQKFEKIANAQLRKDMGLTFKPEINQKSIQLCKQKGLETVHVAERLSAMQPSVHLDCKLEPQKNQSTFAPEINKNTDYIIASSRQFGGGSIGFLDRQKQYMQTVQEKKKAKEHGTPVDLTFRPDIGNSALILKQSHGQDVLQETPVERFERLAYKDREQLWHARDKVTQAYYAQFHFQPEIDGFSRFLAHKNNSVYDLYKNEKGRKVKEALEQAAQNEFQKKCPFRPEVNSTAQRNGDVQLQSIIIQRRKLRKEKANSEQESRTLRELQELKECTFKPSVNPSPPKETAPAIIKGLERHLELQCIAKQMRREQEELERKVFFSHASAMPMRQYTIPRPFVLQTAQGRCNRRI